MTIFGRLFSITNKPRCQQYYKPEYINNILLSISSANISRSESQVKSIHSIFKLLSSSSSSSCQVTWPSERGHVLNREFLSNLQLKEKIFEIYGAKSLYPFPFALTNEQLVEMQHLQEALHAALKCVVNAYSHDSFVRSQYDFDDLKINRLLDLYQNKPYEHVGSYRWEN